MLIELAIDEYIHIVGLRLKSADDKSVTYEYCADHNNDWVKYITPLAKTITMLFDIFTPTEMENFILPPQENGLCTTPAESTNRNI